MGLTLLPLTEDMSMQWVLTGEIPEVFFAQKLTTLKRMLILAMDINGIAFLELCEPKMNLRSEAYQAFFDRNVKGLANKNGVRVLILLHDNVRIYKFK